MATVIFIDAQLSIKGWIKSIEAVNAAYNLKKYLFWEISTIWLITREINWRVMQNSISLNFMCDFK